MHGVIHKKVQPYVHLVIRCTIWYHLYNLKNVKNTQTLSHECFSRFLNCTNGAKSLKTSHTLCHFTVHLVFFETMQITKDNPLLITSTYSTAIFRITIDSTWWCIQRILTVLFQCFAGIAFNVGFIVQNKISNKHSCKNLFKKW